MNIHGLRRVGVLVSGLGRVITSVVAIAAVSGPEMRETLTHKRP